METFEWIIALLLGAALLSILARRVGAPYPTFLAIGGAALAFVPNSPEWTLDPHLALTLFVAPVLVDAAYDASLRDLRDNWAPVAGLVLVSVVATTAAVAVLARFLVPDMPWAVAIAMGAVVAPPDAAAASAVVRQVGLPHRIVKILEGESLLNDASALLIWRLATLAAVGGMSLASFAPILLLTVVGSVVCGHLAARATGPLIQRVHDAPTATIIQFSTTFGISIAAEAAGLSGILTIVVYAMTAARVNGPGLPARTRIPVFAVWETAVFVLNAFAFVLIGLQLRPIWERLGDQRFDYAGIAVACLVVVIAARFAWVMTYNKAIRWRIERRGFNPRRATMMRPTIAGGLVISWAGMRGIVTLAAAFAVPETLSDGSPFPYRDLILLTAFTVTFGTLVIQGLTLKPLIQWLGLSDDDPVGQEVRRARIESYRAALAAIGDDDTLAAKLLRKEYGAAIELNERAPDDPGGDLFGGALRRKAIAAAREKAVELRRTSVIGDDAYHVIQEELDWAELSAG